VKNPAKNKIKAHTPASTLITQIDLSNNIADKSLTFLNRLMDTQNRLAERLDSLDATQATLYEAFNELNEQLDATTDAHITQLKMDLAAYESNLRELHGTLDEDLREQA